jgi:hypothetical protein
MRPTRREAERRRGASEGVVKGAMAARRCHRWIASFFGWVEHTVLPGGEATSPHRVDRVVVAKPGLGGK